MGYVMHRNARRLLAKSFEAPKCPVFSGMDWEMLNQNLGARMAVSPGNKEGREFQKLPGEATETRSSEQCRQGQLSVTWGGGGSVRSTWNRCERTHRGFRVVKRNGESSLMVS